MGADKSAENTPNVPNFICPNSSPSPKVWDFDEKRLHWASVVRAPGHSGGRQSAANFEFS